MKKNILEKIDNLDDIVLEQELSSIFSLLGLYEKRLDMEYYMNLHGQQIVFEEVDASKSANINASNIKQSYATDLKPPEQSLNSSSSQQPNQPPKTPNQNAGAANNAAPQQKTEESKSTIRKILELLPRAIRAVAQFIANMMNKVLGDVEAQRVASLHKTLRDTPGVKEALNGMTDEQAASLVANLLQSSVNSENDANTPQSNNNAPQMNDDTSKNRTVQQDKSEYPTEIKEYALIQEDVDQLAIDKMAADQYLGKNVSGVAQQVVNAGTKYTGKINNALTTGQNIANNVGNAANAASTKVAALGGAGQTGQVDAEAVKNVLLTIAGTAGDVSQILNQVASALKVPIGIISWIRNAKNLIEFIEMMYYDMKLTIKSSVESAVDVAALNIQKYVDKLNPVKNTANINNKGIQIIIAMGDLQNAIEEGKVIDNQLAALDALLNNAGAQGMTQFVQSAVQKVGVKKSLSALQTQVFRLQKTIDDKNSPFGQWINQTLNARIENAYGDTGDEVTERSQYSEQIKNAQGYVKLLLGMTGKANKLCGLIASGIQAVDKLTRLLGTGVKRIADFFASGLTEVQIQQERRELEFAYRHSPELQQKLLAEFDQRAALWGTNREDVAQQYQRDINQYQQIKAQNDAQNEQAIRQDLEQRSSTRGIQNLPEMANDAANVANVVNNVGQASNNIRNAFRNN